MSITHAEIQRLFYEDELWVSAIEEDDKYLVDFVRQYLITEEQKKRLQQLNADIDDLFCGRVKGDELSDDPYSYFFDDWNEKLGRKEFGF